MSETTPEPEPAPDYYRPLSEADRQVGAAILFLIDGGAALRKAEKDLSARDPMSKAIPAARQHLQAALDAIMEHWPKGQGIPTGRGIRLGQGPVEVHHERHAGDTLLFEEYLKPVYAHRDEVGLDTDRVRLTSPTPQSTAPPHTPRTAPPRSR